MVKTIRFKEKNVLITGAASGIGKAAALRFAQEGANVAVADINYEGVKLVNKQINKMGRKAVALQVNVTLPEENQRMIIAAVQALGELNIIFANAGIGGRATQIQDMSPEAWQKIINTNLSGVFYTCKYSIPTLIKSPGNSIITMGSSMAGWDTSLGGAAYMASKEGVTGLTKSLALQLARYGVRVNSICPGIIKTHLHGKVLEEKNGAYAKFSKRIPLRRVGLTEDVAAAVAFLASDDACHITGSMLLIDGGQTLQSWSNAPDDEAFPLRFNIEEMN
ncbi:MAG TPA: SDR family oxidoreductase [Anaerolineae bacterium]|nr:SDR family oxidoreductase [Anaerolineae bacterium]